MKKLILVLAILAIASPAFAVLDVNLVRVGDDVQIVYTGADPCNLPRGFALVISIDSGASIDGVTGYKTGVSTAASQGYGIYPATIVIDGNDGSVVSDGNPIASAGDPLPVGADQTLPSNKIVLEFGSLYAPVAYPSPNAPASSGTLCTLGIDCNGASDANITMVGESTYRIAGAANSGVILEDSTLDTVNKTLAYSCDCLTLGQVFSKEICDPNLVNDITITQTHIDRWNYLGKPQCWCCNAQKCGNGRYSGSSLNRVDAFDLADVKTSYFKMWNQTGYLPCSDFNLTGRVDAVDLSVLKLHFFKVTGSVGCL